MLTRQALRALLLDVIDAVAPGSVPDPIDDDADIREQMDLDSMDLLNVIAAVHERTGIDVPDSDVEEMTTVNKAISYLSQHSS